MNMICEYVESSLKRVFEMIQEVKDINFCHVLVDIVCCKLQTGKYRLQQIRYLDVRHPLLYRHKSDRFLCVTAVLVWKCTHGVVLNMCKNSDPSEKCAKSSTIAVCVENAERCFLHMSHLEQPAISLVWQQSATEHVQKKVEDLHFLTSNDAPSGTRVAFFVHGTLFIQ